MQKSLVIMIVICHLAIFQSTSFGEQKKETEEQKFIKKMALTLSNNHIEMTESSMVSYLIMKASPEQEKQIAQLVVELGANDAAVRENAHEKLIGFGKLALAQVRKAEQSQDAEVVSRAQRILPTIANNHCDIGLAITHCLPKTQPSSLVLRETHFHQLYKALQEIDDQETKIQIVRILAKERFTLFKFIPLLIRDLQGETSPDMRYMRIEILQSWGYHMSTASFVFYALPEEDIPGNLLLMLQKEKDENVRGKLLNAINSQCLKYRSRLDAVPILVGLMKAPLSDENEQKTIQTLDLLTGQKFGNETELWDKWWQDTPDCKPFHKLSPLDPLPPETAPELVTTLQGIKNPALRRMAAAQLSDLARREELPREAFLSLLDAFRNDKDPDVRYVIKKMILDKSVCETLPPCAIDGIIDVLPTVKDSDDAQDLVKCLSALSKSNDFSAENIDKLIALENNTQYLGVILALNYSLFINVKEQMTKNNIANLCAIIKEKPKYIRELPKYALAGICHYGAAKQLPDEALQILANKLVDQTSSLQDEIAPIIINQSRFAPLTPAATKILENLLSDTKDKSTRREIIESLRNAPKDKIGSARFVEIMRDIMLNDKDEGLRLRATAALASYPKPPADVEQLICSKLSDTFQPTVKITQNTGTTRIYLFQALADLCTNKTLSPQGLDFMRKNLCGAGSEMRISMAERCLYLAESDKLPKELIPTLEKIMNSDNIMKMQLLASATLCCIPEKQGEAAKVLKELAEILKLSGEKSLFIYLTGLAQNGKLPEDCFPIIYTQIKIMPDQDARYNAIEFFEDLVEKDHYPASATSQLIALLENDTNPILKLYIAKVFTRLAEKNKLPAEALEALNNQFLSSNNEYVRFFMGLKLCQMAKHDLLPISVSEIMIRSLQSEKRYEIRGRALECLRCLSKKDFGFKVEEWKKWWNENRSKVQVEKQNKGVDDGK